MSIGFQFLKFSRFRAYPIKPDPGFQEDEKKEGAPQEKKQKAWFRV